jgi:hypothetical protein
MQPFNQKKPGSKHRAEEILKLLEEFEYSDGMSVKAFSSLHGVSEATFYNWRKRYSGKKGDNRKSAGFIEILPSASGPSVGLFAEIRGIKLFQAVPAEYLKTLLS